MTTPAMRLHTPGVAADLADALAAITVRLGLSRTFPADVVDEARRAAARALPPARDLTHLPFVTIDPEGSTDLDQAVHIEPHGDGYLVRYAIADVPAFVAPGGAIDAEARRRGQTIYAPDGRIPLHPEVLSEGAASLLPGETRPAFVWELKLDAAAAVTSARVGRAHVTSTRQFSYPEAQREIEQGSAPATLLLLKRVGMGRVALERERGGASLRIPSVDIEPESASDRDGGYRLVRRSPLPVEDWNAQVSLMTGMAAAELMLAGGIGILRTMPPPERAVIDDFRRQAEALGHPWSDGMAYGEYLRTLDADDPRHLALMHSAGSLFRGAGYTAFDGAVPANTRQAAVAAPYAHVTAPLRRLVDRFGLVACEALCAGAPVPVWVRDALPGLPGMMAASDQVAGAVDRAALDTVEAAVLHRLVGQTFDATVISAGECRGRIQVTDPAVTATCTGSLQPGSRIRARLVEATIATGTIRFELAPEVVEGDAAETGGR